MWKKLGSFPLDYISPPALSLLISVLSPYTPLLDKSFREQKEKCSSSTRTIEGLGSSKLACQTDSIYREDTYIYIFIYGRDLASSMSKSLQTEQDLSRTCSQLLLIMPWRCSDKVGGGTGELFSAFKAYKTLSAASSYFYSLFKHISFLFHENHPIGCWYHPILVSLQLYQGDNISFHIKTTLGGEGEGQIKSQTSSESDNDESASDLWMTNLTPQAHTFCGLQPA